MVSDPHSSTMALGRLFNISRENSPEIFEMVLPKSHCREYADIDPTMQNRLGKLGKSSQQKNSHRVYFFRKILHKISMCRLLQVSANFNCSVPRSVGLTGIFTEKVPNIASIKGTTISLHSR